MSRHLPVTLIVATLAVIGTAHPIAASDLTGTWHGQGSSSGRWYSGPWRLTGSGSERTMYFNGSGSACPGQAIQMQYTLNGSTFELSGQGCGTQHKATGTVGSSRIDFQKNKYGKPYITGVSGW